MLTGDEFGKAFREAMRRMGVAEKRKLTQQEIADAFGVSQPSVAEWLKHGRIDKRHLPKLLDYFKAVAGPAHWGLPFSDEEFALILAFRELPEATRTALGRKARELADKAIADRKSLADMLEEPEAGARDEHRKRRRVGT